jgi:hypothetical protein
MKMMKEERDLRKKLAYSYETGHSIMVDKYVSKDISALIAAVRADERERCANVSKGMVKYGGNRYSDSYNRACEEIAAAIRARK